MNSIHVIHPYQDGGALVFDDPAVELRKEAFIAGADLVLQLAARLAGADPARFTLLFSADPFPGRQAVATWLEPGDFGYGNWYAIELPGLGRHEAWLCPALLKYFASPPASIHFQILPFNPKESA